MVLVQAVLLPEIVLWATDTATKKMNVVAPVMVVLVHGTFALIFNTKSQFYYET